MGLPIKLSGTFLDNYVQSGNVICKGQDFLGASNFGPNHTDLFNISVTTGENFFLFIVFGKYLT